MRTARKTRYIAAAGSDAGIGTGSGFGTGQKVNQDSILLRHAVCRGHEVLLAAVCDGMGGLAEGEVASASAIRALSGWFEEELDNGLYHAQMPVIGKEWAAMLNLLNRQMAAYGSRRGAGLGTTFTGMLFVDKKYVIVHVGDTRVYHIGSGIQQMTEDQTLVAEEIACGRMTPEQAERDSRRNLLLQCIGASRSVEPQILCGTVRKGVYVLCSDGFRHVILPQEMQEQLNADSMKSGPDMLRRIQELVKEIRRRNEKDDISVVLVQCR